MHPALSIVTQQSNSTEAGKGFNKLLCGIGYESSHMHLKLQELKLISFISESN